MSLASRLTSFFLTAVALLLVGFSGALYQLARTYMHHDLDERLANSLDVLAMAATDRPGTIVWKPGMMRWPVGVCRRGDHPVRWIVFDGRGDAQERCWDFGSDDVAALLDMVPPTGHSHDSYTGRDGRRWRLVLRHLPAPPPQRLDEETDEEERDEEHDRETDEDVPPSHGKFTPGRADAALLIVTGLPLGPVEANLRNVALGLVGISGGLWGLAAVAGRRFCRRALQPMTSMAAAAQAMPASDQSHHLPSPGTGDELEDLAHAFNGLLDRLDDALEQQKRFAGDASHQLRTPLTALIGEIEVARRRDRPAEEYREVLDEVHGEAIRLRQIIESLLFLARAEADAGCPDLCPTDLASWLPAHLRGWSAHDRGCDIHADPIPAGPLVVRAQTPLLGQLLDNLLENACKYSDPGTPIRVRLVREPGAVTLAVEDRGVGLSPEEVPHVFEPFYRSPRTHLRGDQGLGLGLAVVHRIASAFGATVSVESDPGRGTRFLVRFAEARP
jgi:two-component system OmpR family sensor kinase